MVKMEAVYKTFRMEASISPISTDVTKDAPIDYGLSVSQCLVKKICDRSGFIYQLSHQLQKTINDAYCFFNWLKYYLNHRVL